MSEGQSLISRIATDPHERALLYVTAIGLLIGIARVLVDESPRTWQKTIGISLLNAATTLSAFTILAFIPDAPLALIVGFASLVGTMGSVGLARLLDTFLSKKFNVSITNDQSKPKE